MITRLRTTKCSTSPAASAARNRPEGRWDSAAHGLVAHLPSLLASPGHLSMEARHSGPETSSHLARRDHCCPSPVRVTAPQPMIHRARHEGEGRP
ncbi:MAG: hypothetical protein WDW38_010966 [Sanguina aurantia]